MSTFSRWEISILLAVCLGCVTYQALQRQIGFYGAETDLYSFYALTAQALHDGVINIDDFHPPLYGWILGLLTYIPIFPGPFEAGVFWSVLSYLGIIIGTVLMVRNAGENNLRMAWMAGLLVAANPTLADQSCRAIAHVFFLAISLWSIYFVLRQKAVLAGLFVAIAIWTRATWMLSVIPLIFLRGKNAWRGWAIAAVAIVGLALLTHAYKGSWSLGTNKLNIAAGLYDKDVPMNAGLWVHQHQAQFGSMNVLEIFLYDVHKAVTSIWSHLTEFSGKLLMSVAIPPLGIFALFGWRRMGLTALKRNPLIAWTTAAFALLVLSYWGPQYVIGFVPLLSIGAATQLAQWPVTTRLKYVPQATIYLSVALGMFLMLSSFGQGPRDVKRAAQLLKTLPGNLVVARDSRVFYYSGKSPGELSIRKDGALILTGDYVFVSNFECSANDTLRRLIRDPEFLSGFEVRGFPGAVILHRLTGGKAATDSLKAANEAALKSF